LHQNIKQSEIEAFQPLEKVRSKLSRDSVYKWNKVVIRGEKRDKVIRNKHKKNKKLLQV